MRTDEAYISMMQFEDQVNNYLSSNCNFMHDHCTIIRDKRLQYKGIDISSDNGLLIDAKIKNTNSINEIFQYPSVEITIHDNQMSGWFIDPKMETNAYLFISVFSDELDYHKIKVDNIQKLNCLIFSKKQLVRHIENYVTLQQLHEDALTLCKSRQRKDYRDRNGIKLFHLKYSPYLEGAVNLVINREVLLNLKGSKEFYIKRACQKNK